MRTPSRGGGAPRPPGSSKKPSDRSAHRGAPADRASRRADRTLVERGLAPTREKAQALILAGRVSADGRRVEKAGAILSPGAKLAVAPGPRFVGRGGEKLDGALTRFGLDVTGLRALDVGASTGGFTDCLLQRGARHVVALDVGRGQLDWSLRNDPRVTVVEGVNVRWIEPGDVAGPFDIIVVDVSFISLRLVLPAIAPLLAMHTAVLSEPSIVCLVKPQFEVGKGEVGKGGIVRDAAKQLAVLLEVIRFADGLPAAVEGALATRLGAAAIAESPLRGAEGNREFFVRFVRGPGRDPGLVEEEARRVVDAGSQG